MEAAVFFTKSEENLTAARLCLQNGLCNASANRAYYAMFQAAATLLMERGIDLSGRKQLDHAPLQSLFANELIHRRKILNSKFKSYLPDAQTIRNAADYQAVVVSKKKANRLLAQAEEFVKAINEVLRYA